MWAEVGPAVLMDFPQPVGLCVRTQALGFFFFFLLRQLISILENA